MSGSNKRQAQSPLSGDEEDLKRRIIMEEAPILVTLDETFDSECKDATANGDSELLAILEGGTKSEDKNDQPPPEKVDRLIDRMDRFMECFANLHSTVIRNQASNLGNLKRLETTHNDMVNKVVKSAESTEGRFETLECLSVNAKLTERIDYLEGEQSRRFNVQRQLIEENSKKTNSLEVDLGFTNRNMFDRWADTKERKIVISGIAESSGEDVKTTALNAINKVVTSALTLKDPLTGLESSKPVR